MHTLSSFVKLSKLGISSIGGTNGSFAYFIVWAEFVYLPMFFFEFNVYDTYVELFSFYTTGISFECRFTGVNVTMYADEVPLSDIRNA